MAALPAITEAVSTIIRTNRSISARLKADPETKAMAALPEKTQKDVLAARDGVIAADDKVIDQEALRDMKLRLLRGAIKTLGIKAFGHFESRTAEGYRRIFKKAPSILASQTKETERDEVFGSLVIAAQESETPKELKAPVVALAKSFAEYQREQAALVKLEAALEKAKQKQARTVEGAVMGMRRVLGQLTDRFPDDKERVDSYFPRVSAPKKKGDKKPEESKEKGTEKPAEV